MKEKIISNNKMKGNDDSKSNSSVEKVNPQVKTNILNVSPDSSDDGKFSLSPVTK